MSTSDQDQDQDRDRRKGRDRGTDAPIAEDVRDAEDTDTGTGKDIDVEDRRTGIGDSGTEAGDSGTRFEDGETGGADTETGGADSETDVGDGETGKRLTPRQARRLRIVLSSVGMAAMGVVLALRIASRSSVLVVGVYGLALILCGLVIELSRNGRTRLGSWLLGAGLVAAVGADWLLLP
ncbi:hypothetical protein [Streptomyces sp. NPDC007346]|uniref:hypothetical protein n=1 Tax=Streptomyces sp. NPDC007346 TaxID=3154682 RepID=UPI0034564696